MSHPRCACGIWVIPGQGELSPCGLTRNFCFLLTTQNLKWESCPRQELSPQTAFRCLQGKLLITGHLLFSLPCADPLKPQGALPQP